MEVLLQYQQAVTTHSVTLSTLTDVGGYIMPPLSIEVWGGEEEHQLKLLGRVTPSQPDKVQPSALRGYEVKFSPTKLKWIKLVAVPVSKLPAWHPGKGDKGWVFVDEILVN